MRNLFWIYQSENASKITKNKNSYLYCVGFYYVAEYLTSEEKIKLHNYSIICFLIKLYYSVVIYIT